MSNQPSFPDFNQPQQNQWGQVTPPAQTPEPTYHQFSENHKPAKPKKKNGTLIGILLLVGVFVVAGLATWIQNTVEDNIRDDIYTYGVSTTATPVEVRYNKPRRGIGYYYVVYEYTVNEKTYTVRGHENIFSDKSLDSIDDETVYYMEDDPSKAAIKYEGKIIEY